MEERQAIEDKIKLALNELALSINSGSKTVSDNSLLIEVSSQIPVSNMEYWERFIREEYSTVLKSTEQPKWKIWSTPSPFLTWVDLCSWDGYRREKTLRTLTVNVPNRFLLALVFRRLNDWVPQVRLAARELLPRIINGSNPSHVVDAICFTLSHWSSWKRIEELDRKTLLEAISNKEFSNIVKEKIITATSGPVTLILAQASRTPILDSSYYQIAHKAIQPSVRAKAYRSLLDNKVTWIEGKKWVWTDIKYCKGRMKAIVSERDLSVTTPFLSTLQSAAIDNSSIVRRVAAEFLIKELGSLGDEAVKLAELFSKDKSTAVAERGAFALKKIGAEESA